MKLEVGKFIRTKSSGLILEITEDIIGGIKSYIGEEKYQVYDNIIDLIEYMDLLEIQNPIKLYGKDTEISFFNPVRCDGFTTFEDGPHCIILDLDYLVDVKDLKIKSILTHESFENNCYKVGD